MKSIWIARSKYGYLGMFKSKPKRSNSYWDVDLDEDYCSIDDDWFPELTWESEPLELVIKENDICKSCSNCMYFKDEAIDGTGICHIFKTEHFYNDEGCSDWEKK